MMHAGNGFILVFGCGLLAVVLLGHASPGDEPERAGDLDRRRLHALLDRWRIPYRSPEAEITAILGTTSDIRGGDDVCALPFPAELSQGTGQLSFWPRGEPDSDARIGAFFLRYGRDDGARPAFDELAEILARDLGPGSALVTANARNLEWKRGRARVSLVVFEGPSGGGADDDAFNARHCSLWIEPGWAPEPSKPETAAIDRATDIAPIDGLSVHEVMLPWSRMPADDGGTAGDAIRFDAASATLIVMAKDGSTSLVPLSSVKAIVHEKFFPAKGAGFVTARLQMETGGRHTADVAILHGPWEARDALAAWIDAFSERTGIPVTVTEDPDA